jgi:hypothetical protein
MTLQFPVTATARRRPGVPGQWFRALIALAAVTGMSGGWFLGWLTDDGPKGAQGADQALSGVRQSETPSETAETTSGTTETILMPAPEPVRTRPESPPADSDPSIDPIPDRASAGLSEPVEPVPAPTPRPTEAPSSTASSTTEPTAGTDVPPSSSVTTSETDPLLPLLPTTP